jgi:hypothetical protein
MSLKNFNVQNGLSVNDVQVVDSNSNVIANALISNTFISTNNSNITLNPDGSGVIDVSNKTISNLAEPQNPTDAATKRYVDGVAQGLNLHIPAAAGTPSLSLATITGGSVTYNNGTNGYGATLTLSTPLTTIDGYTITLGVQGDGIRIPDTQGDRLLIKDESNKITNGIYTINYNGTVLTRALDSDQTVELDGGDFVFIQSGNTLKATGWVQTAKSVVIGTNDILFEQFSGSGAAATNVSASVGDITITGGTTDYVLAATNSSGGLHYANIANYFLVTSNISTVVAGSTLAFTVDYGNTSYPGGIYTLKQLGPVSLSISDQWSIGGSTVGTTKNAYANYVASTVNTANVSIAFTLSNANFSLQSTDSLTIGSTTINNSSSPNLKTLLSSIDGRSSGTVVIPATSLNANVNSNGLSTVTNPVSVTLTNDRGSTGSGVSTASGTSLVATAPTAYSVNSISGSFPSSSIPYWNLNQSFNWNVSVTGTTSAGNLTYSGGAISTTSLSSLGGLSGTSGSIDSTSSYTITTNDYYGAGLNGYGNRTIPSAVNGTVNSATKYYPLFWKITNNNSLPSFAVSDSHNSNNYVTGQGATTSTTSSQYLWLAIPNSGNASPLATHTFKHVFGGFDIVDSPTVVGIQTITSSGQSYNYSIYGFSGFTTASFILTTS